ncbi:MAG: class I lanthipeptide [Candidatus Aminicenantes bacterium]|nr:class I lanthipeptide [Candidatus Aminicenantes bacterium]
MKKKIKNKLALNRSTIARLDPQDKIKIKGGNLDSAITVACYTEHKSCSIQINCCPPPEKLDNETFNNC